MSPLLATFLAERLVRLSGVDLAIIVFYFLLVLGIGFYLKRFANTGEDFFLAGREMTAWVAGLAFVSANLGSLELLGWAGSAYQYGIMAAHWYWVGAIPAMIFLGLVMMPFYYISKTHSVPGYLKLRYGTEAAGLSAVTFAVMTILMSGVNMYAMAVVMKVVLGPGWPGRREVEGRREQTGKTMKGERPCPTSIRSPISCRTRRSCSGPARTTPSPWPRRNRSGSPWRTT